MTPSQVKPPSGIRILRIDFEEPSIIARVYLGGPEFPSLKNVNLLSPAGISME